MRNFCIVIVFFSFMPLFGCATKYIEKQSEATSQVAWASYDSAQVGRYDLTDFYLTQLTKLIKVPEKRIPIQKFSYKKEIKK